MLRVFVNEVFKELPLKDQLKRNYAVSNYGRLISYKTEFEDGKVLKGSTADGFRVLRYKVTENEKIVNKHIFIYKIVGELFLEKPSSAHEFLIHLDYSRNNDYIGNLKWVTKEERAAHHAKSPFVIEARIKLKNSPNLKRAKKLKLTQVILLKRQLLDPNRKTKLKILARQFGVTEMQLNRIKRGENWGYVKVDIPNKE